MFVSLSADPGIVDQDVELVAAMPLGQFGVEFYGRYGQGIQWPVNLQTPTGRGGRRHA
jgi:hypothetical protein